MRQNWEFWSVATNLLGWIKTKGFPGLPKKCGLRRPSTSYIRRVCFIPTLSTLVEILRPCQAQSGYMSRRTRLSRQCSMPVTRPSELSTRGSEWPTEHVQGMTYAIYCNYSALTLELSDLTVSFCVQQAFIGAWKGFSRLSIKKDVKSE